MSFYRTMLQRAYAREPASRWAMLVVAFAACGWSHARGQSPRRPPLRLLAVGAFGSGDSVGAFEAEVLETLAAGRVYQELAAALDVGAGRLVRIRVDSTGTFVEPTAAGGVGRRGMGRMLSPCCVAFEPSGAIVVLDRSAWRFTKFPADMRPVMRWSAPDLGTREVGGLVRQPDAHAWLLAATNYSEDMVLRVLDGGTAWDTLTRVGRQESGPTDSVLTSPPSLIALRDGGYVLGSGRSPLVAKLDAAGLVLWVRALEVPAVPDALPVGGPSRVSQASFRVSSIVELPDGGLLTTLFRPARRHTVLVLLDAGGAQIETAVFPVPLWFYGVTTNGLLVGARVHAYHELVAYRVPTLSPN